MVHGTCTPKKEANVKTILVKDYLGTPLFQTFITAYIFTIRFHEAPHYQGRTNCNKKEGRAKVAAGKVQ